VFGLLTVVVFLIAAPVVSATAVGSVSQAASGSIGDGSQPLFSSHSPPTASFSYSPSTPNPDDTITLDASDSSDDGSLVSYEWDGDGDGDYSDSYSKDPADGQTTTISFGSGGTYTVGLRITDDNGNTETTTKQITVDNPAPEPSFSYSPSTPNPGDTISLDASGSSDSDGSIVSYEWDGDGDGDYSDSYSKDPRDGQTTSLQFGSGGTYTVGLKVTDNGGKERTISKQITVDNPAPEPSFSYSPSTPNPDDTISLDASGSSDSDGSIVSYEWDGDGDGDYSDSYSKDPSDGQTTSISYGSGGIYTVGLKITDNGGKERTVTKQITVDNPAPEPSFSYSPSAPNPDDTISLDASGSSDSDGSIVSYEWDGDGDGDYSDSYSKDPSDGQTTSLKFGSGGTYTVGLKVTDNGGKERTVSKQITVDNPAPDPSFSYSPSPPNPGDTISLDASGSSDSDGSIVSYEWDGDGDGDYSDSYSKDPSDGQTTTVSYDTGGTHTVGLKVTDNGGKTVTTTQQITVENTAPSARINVSPTMPTPGSRVQLDASGSTDPDGQIESYNWFVNGDEIGHEQTLSFRIRRQGTYEVRLEVIDSGRLTATNSTTIGVSSPPEPSITTAPATIGTGASVTFDAGDSTDTDGRITSYQWQFQDGTTATGETVSRSFDRTGERNVTLTVTDDSGQERSLEKSITVHPAPDVSMAVTPENPIEGAPVELTASSEDAIQSYEWVIDGTTYTGATASHAFTEAGDQTVVLRATSADGVTTQVSQAVSVDQNASFELTSV
jgi:PKD repeat protein